MSNEIILRINDNEFRWSKDNNRFELIKWYKCTENKIPEYCYVIAFFKVDQNGYDMRTVGERYIDALLQDTEGVKILTQYAFEVIGAKFRANDQIQQM